MARNKASPIDEGDGAKGNTMIWLTSDLHINHENIIRYAQRPFDSVDEMNESIIDNINERVTHEDTLWILGDVSMGRDKLQTTKKVLGRLCTKDVHLVLGNHDPANRIDDLLVAGFVSVDHYKEVMLWNKHSTGVLFHYPLMSWNGRSRGAYMLHGHIHAKSDYNERNRKNGLRRYDVGVDANDYAPVSIDHIKDFFHGMEVMPDFN